MNCAHLLEILIMYQISIILIISMVLPRSQMFTQRLIGTHACLLSSEVLITSKVETYSFLGGIEKMLLPPEHSIAQTQITIFLTLKSTLDLGIH